MTFFDQNVSNIAKSTFWLTNAFHPYYVCDFKFLAECLQKKLNNW